MSIYVFVDNSNVWIEGKYASAVHKGLCESMIEAHRQKILNNAWKLDFGKLLVVVTENKLAEIKEAIIIGSKPTDKDSLWEAMESAGFIVHSHPRNKSNKEKKVDTGIVQAINKKLYKESQEEDVFILVMGDSDYVPVVEEIENEGRIAKIAFWQNVSGELIAAASNYLDLTPHIDNLSY